MSYQHFQRALCCATICVIVGCSFPTPSAQEYRAALTRQAKVTKITVNGEEQPLNNKKRAKLEQSIKNREVVHGMTQEQVRLSWGKPRNVGRFVSGAGNMERWQYGRCCSGAVTCGISFLTFIDGRLDSIYQSTC